MDWPTMVTFSCEGRHLPFKFLNDQYSVILAFNFSSFLFSDGVN